MAVIISTVKSGQSLINDPLHVILQSLCVCLSVLLGPSLSAPFMTILSSAQIKSNLTLEDPAIRPKEISASAFASFRYG